MSPPGAPETVLIAGAGPVGMMLALRLAAAGRPVRLHDAGSADAYRHDRRALALSAGSRQTLDALGVWPADDATAITTVHVSQAASFGRTVITADDLGLPALGHVVPYRALVGAMRDALTQRGVAPEFDVSADRPPPPCGWHVHAEGGLDTPTCVDYRATAIVCEATPVEAPAGRAWERFTADGPLALLPLGAAYAVVCVVPQARHADVLGARDADFIARLTRKLGDRIAFSSVTPRATFPLALRARTATVRGREVWIGNAAQMLHPVSGQGLNLGLRDAADLADALIGGADPALARYRGRRAPDRWGAIVLTDLLARGFLGDAGPLRAARGVALLGLDLVPPVKHALIRRLVFGWR